MTHHVLVTGATGFVGSALVDHYRALGHKVSRLVRGASDSAADAISLSVLDDSDAATAALRGIDAVIHCAARVHVMEDTAQDPLAAFREVNVELTRRLARIAVDAGVRRFVFISSIKVNGEDTNHRAPFTPSDRPNPLDPYGQSKYEAEQVLFGMAEQSEMGVVVIRPPLVYGRGVKGNFARLIRLADSSLPLPFGALKNKRSLIFIGNLVDVIGQASLNERAVGNVFTVSDGEDLSTTELLRLLREALQRSRRLVPVPAGVFRLLGAALGKADVVERLVGSLQVDNSLAKAVMNWEPPYSVEEGIRLTLGKVQS